MSEKELDIDTAVTEQNLTRLREMMIAMLQSDDPNPDMFKSIISNPAKARAILEAEHTN
jgi:hypothetical protein